MKKIVLAFVLLFAFTSPAAAAEEAVLRIGIDAPYMPFAYTDPATGKLTGFDYDIAEALCKRLNRSCDIQVVAFDDIIPSIVAGKLDIGVAGMAKKPEREALVLFSDKYFRSSSLFIGFTGTVQGTRESLTGKKIAVQNQTTQQDYLLKTYGDVATIVPFKSFDDIINATLSKTVDIAFIDGLPGYEFLKSEKGSALDIIGEPVKLGSGSCVVLHKSLTKERDAINQAIVNMRKDGEYDAINAKYFEFNIY